MILREFFNSSFWSEIRVRVLATFGLAGIGTAGNAIPPLTVEQSEVFIDLQYLIAMSTLVSYILSALVAVTVLWRFILWLKDRKQTKKQN